MLYDIFSHDLCLVIATVYFAEHLTRINKIYSISGLCSGTYLLALGHLSFFENVLWSDQGIGSVLI